MAGAVDMEYLVKGRVRRAESSDGTIIRYSSRGRGLPLVVCNGVANTTTFWHYFEDHFSKIARVICWDYRGHGRSDVPRDLDSFTVEYYVKDLLAVLDHAKVERAVLVGFSMGVHVILELYRQCPERVQSLIIINGACSYPFEAFSASERFDKLYTRVFSFFADHARGLERIGVPLLLSPLPWPLAKLVEIDGHRASKKEMDLYFEHIAKMGFANELRALLGMAHHSAEGVLAEVKVPTLVIAGEKDGACPARLVEKISKGIKGSELFIVPHGTHATIIEVPDLINYRIEAFLRKHDFLPEV